MREVRQSRKSADGNADAGDSITVHIIPQIT
jgi:hypothetical protein